MPTNSRNHKKTFKTVKFHSILDKTHLNSIYLLQKFKFWIVFIFCILPSFLFSQIEITRDVNEVIQSIIEEYVTSIEGSEELDINTWTEDLITAYQHPLDLNIVTRQELEELIILTDNEINSILEYRNKYGPFVTIYEIQAIESLTPDKIVMISHFISVENKVKSATTSSPLIVDTKGQLFVKWRRILERQKGFSINSNGERPYSGSADYLYTRFVHDRGNKRYGFTLEKDQGEKIFASNSKTGFDFFSFHYQVTQPTKWLNQLNLGDYSISLGLGLIAHNNFGLGKSSFSTNIRRGGKTIKPYTSVSENLSFRGAAADIKLNQNVKLITFASYDYRDANIVVDDDKQTVAFTSLQSSGYHRTSSEKEDQDAVGNWVVGGSVSWDHKWFQVALNTIHHGFSIPRSSGGSPSKLYNWSGNQISNYSIDYNTHIEGWNLFGEIAVGNNGGWAQQYGLLKTLDPKFDISMIYRDYAPEYTALSANGFGESTLVKNERGLYFGTEFRPSKPWKIRAYADFWKHPWLKFRVDGIGVGSEYLVRIDYSQRYKRNYYLQYKYEKKDENAKSPSTIDRPISRQVQRLRLHATHHLSSFLEIRSRIELSSYQKEGLTSNGILIYQDVLYHPSDLPITLSSRVSYFNTEGFNARIYAYENDLLYEYYIPAFWDEGVRTYINLRYQWNHQFMTEVRIGRTQYFNRDHVSSGLNLIESPHVTRIKAQIRYKF